MRYYGTTFSDDDVRLLKTYGMGLEISQCMSATGIEAFPQHRTSLEAMLEGSVGRSLHGACYDMNYVTTDPDILAVVNRRFGQSLTVARALDIHRIVFHSSYTCYDDKSPQTLQKWVDRSIAFWHGFLRNVPENMVILLENVDDENPAALRDVIRGVGDRRFRCCFDAGHAFCRSSVSSEHWITTLLDEIAHVHIHDNRGANDDHRALGSGIIPYKRLIPLLAESLPPDVPCVLECDKCASIAWLEENNLIPSLGDG